METKGTTGEETISYWFDLPIDVAEFEEKLGVGAESGDYRIIEKVLPYAFRSTDINEIKQTLEFFGIDKDDENNQKRLRDLENGQCLLQDLYGRVGVVQIHPVFEELLHAFDTRPPVQRNEVE